MSSNGNESISGRKRSLNIANRGTEPRIAFIFDYVPPNELGWVGRAVS